jgi:hypothetical protein
VSTKRQKLLQLLHGEDPGEIIVCPLIDSWAFEDTSEKVFRPDEDEFTIAHTARGPIEDQLHMGELCGYEPIALQDIDWTLANPNLRWEEELVSKDLRAQKRVDRLSLHTPYGDIVRRRESSLQSSMLIDEFDLMPDQLHRIVEWYTGEIAACDLDAIGAQIKGYVDIRGERGLLSSAVANPFNLFGLLGRGFEHLVYHYADYPEEHHRLANLVLEVAKFQADVILDGGYDVIWAGHTGGSTYNSAQYFRETRMPYEKAVIDHVKRRDGLVYTHDCNAIGMMIREGVFNELGPSCLETLAPPPAGDIDDLRAYRQMLDPSICTKGNIDVGFLLDATVEEVRQATIEVIEATKGFRHMVGTGDDVYFGTPIENIKAMVEVAKGYTGRFFPSVAVGAD